MKRASEAKKILHCLGMPPQQCNDISAMTLLALANIGPKSSWADTEPVRVRIHDILIFAASKYKKKYAENTRETIRRQVIHYFEQAGIVSRNPDEPSLPTNSPRTRYALTEETASLLKTFGTPQWSNKLRDHQAKRKSLVNIYNKKRKMRMIPVKISADRQIELSPGNHNKLQVAVIEKFGPRFAPKSQLLYLGDTAKKKLYFDSDHIKKLGITANQHDKLPDIILFQPKTRRLFLIEVVTSHGPVSPKRHVELEQMLKEVSATRIYVSAFFDFKEFKRHVTQIAWETEVWVEEMPDHMIHFNGDRFLS